MAETKMTETYKSLGLTEEEYRQIVEVLGREPNFTELSMYAVMWSEHCSYKSSKAVLKTLPSEGPRVLQGPGENAGLIDIGDNLAVALKIESHNHPSAIEPFQGAATGVGGIIRDIFTMGARPIALLDPLRFGSLSDPKVKYLFDEVVAGIANYGNSLGVPTVGGDIYFEDAYSQNPLVNVMAVGILPKDKIIKGWAPVEGDPVILIGSKTGRDGIHGVTFASEELSEKSVEKRPSVQIGDPFAEKLLVEACLELNEKKLLRGLQDLGGGGLTCATSETASRGESGMDIEVSRIPRREERMQVFEVMLSESQERMLAIIPPQSKEEVFEICAKWDLSATEVGKVTKTGELRVFEEGRLAAEVPTKSLTEGPILSRVAKKPAYLGKVKKFDLSNLEEPADFNEVFLRLLQSPNICSRRPIYEQYDHQVQTNTVILPGADAAVLRLKGKNAGLAVTTDGNGRYCYLDPFLGAQIAVAEAARNLVCVGAKPLGLTNCLNFGSPENPEVFWQFKEAVRGISEAARALETPVVSGNVSFYNEAGGKAIYPTPIIGMVGKLEELSLRLTPDFKEEGLIVLLGTTRPELGGSEYLRVVHNKVAGTPPLLDLGEEKRVQDLCLTGIEQRLLLSAHDLSEGGLAIALAECAILGDIGAQVDLPTTDYRLSTTDWLFSESQSRILVSLKKKNLARFEEIAREKKVNLTILGEVSGTKLVINDRINLSLLNLRGTWHRGLLAS